MLQPVSLRRATSGDAAPIAPSPSKRTQSSAMASRARSSSTRVALLRVRSSAKDATARTSSPLRATPEGIAIGTAAAAAFHCFNDPLVAPEHGTLECTHKHGVWVYVDHSVLGTTVNGTRRVQNEAVVVRTGDRLLVGSTEIELRFEATTTPTPTHASKDSDLPASQTHGTIRSRHAGIAPSPIEWSARAERTKPLSTATKAFASATPPPPAASPAPGFNPRRKRHSMTAFTPSPAPPPSLGTTASSSSSHFLFQRTRPLVPSAPSTPPRADATRPHQPTQSPSRRRSNQSDDDDAGAEPSSSRALKAAPRTAGSPPPPPLGYSSSPIAGPTSRVGAALHIPQSPSPRLGPQRQPQSQSHHQQRVVAAADPPKSSQRDDLRRRVLKKMELDHLQDSKRDGRSVPSGLQLPLSLTPRSTTQSTAPASATTVGAGTGASSSSSVSPGARRRSLNNQLDFTPPSSPVAHKDILRQKESLLNILKSKYKEEQLLKQQQEEWMRHHFSLATPPLSPVASTTRHDAKDKNNSNDTVGIDTADSSRRPQPSDDGDMSDLEIPPRAPVLLRTISLGIHQASPRLTAAVLASRARFGNADRRTRSNQRSPRDPTALGHACHDSNECSSVSSSVSTELACHRRVTRSLSFSSKEDDADADDDANATATDVHDFMGYEDDDDASDGLTSFTAHGFYSSDDCKSLGGGGATTTHKRLLFSSFYSSPPSTLSSSSTSSLVMTGSATTDRFSVDVVPPREPEDDELLESPKRPSGATVALSRNTNRVDDSAASPNLFDKTQRRLLSKPARSGALRSSEAVSSSVSARDDNNNAARGSRRLPSPV